MVWSVRSIQDFGCVTQGWRGSRSEATRPRQPEVEQPKSWARCYKDLLDKTAEAFCSRALDEVAMYCTV